jgi:hypothetical protein
MRKPQREHARRANGRPLIQDPCNFGNPRSASPTGGERTHQRWHKPTEDAYACQEQNGNFVGISRVWDCGVTRPKQDKAMLGSYQ